MAILHKTHPGQFGMKALAENNWWPHLSREIYFHGKNCTQGLKAGKNIKVLLVSVNKQKLPEFTKPNEKTSLHFAGPLDKNWGTSEYLLPCIDRFTNFPLVKVVRNTSTETTFSFLTVYCNLHGLSSSIRVEHGSCFSSNDFENFGEKNNIN